MKRYLESNIGGALVMVLLVMMTMTILGTTLLSVSLSENKQSIRDNDRLEAYYLARTGVEATASWLLHSDTAPQDISQILNKKSEDSSLGNGKFNVEVIEDSTTRDLIIIGTGFVNGATNSTRMLLEKSSTVNTELDFDYSVYSGEYLSLFGSAEVSGLVGHGTSAIVDAKKHDNLVPIDMDYPKPIFPESTTSFMTTKPTNISFGEGIESIIFSNGIDITENKYILEINTGVGSGNVNIIVDGDFIFSSNNHSFLRIIGDKRVNIYVKGNVDISANINADKTPQQLLFLMDGTGSFSLKNNGFNDGSFKAFIYAPLASFKSTGNSKINGAIIANSVELGGNISSKEFTFDSSNNVVIPIVEVYSDGIWLD